MNAKDTSGEGLDERLTSALPALYHRIGQSLIDAVPTDQCGIWLNFEIIKNAWSGWAFYRKPSGSYGYLEIPDDAEAALLEMHQLFAQWHHALWTSLTFHLDPESKTEIELGYEQLSEDEFIDSLGREQAWQDRYLGADAQIDWQSY
ncbi:immunity protein YezG family protein [Stenotrophomonas maltophilia]|uniref:immunity protein YezG family protein n=1 Tax=Stenotrophomonas maltophilia TaxID=40324 RepID=UPI000C1586AB|nr:immunity protein YezG family protein [Stenotrophomonas maltophilia]